MGVLMIQLVGPFTVLLDGRALPAIEVGSRKARSLLALLATDRGAVVPLDRIAAVLWPDEPPRRPADNVATLVSRIRSRFGADVVLGGRAGYRLGPGAAVDVDVHEAHRLLADAQTRLAAEPALALAAAGRAVAILAPAPVLADEADTDWVRAARADQVETLRRARRMVAVSALRTRQPALARDAAAATVDTDPFDEDACRSLMRAYHELGEPALALAAFERLRATLAGELGVDPSEATRALHVSILRGDGSDDEVTPRAGVPAHGLAGRDRELDRLGAAWHLAAQAHGAVVLISGEAGIGKTRLAEELAGRARASGGRVLRARCYEAERSLFLQPIAETLTGLVVELSADRLREAAADRAGALATLVPEVGALLGAAPVEHGSPDVQRRRAYDAVFTFLRRLAQDDAVLLVIDDLQNAGTATVELLHYLARYADGARLLVLATVRSGEGRRVLSTLAPVAEVVELGALDSATIARLAADAGQAAHAAQIERRTRGHTLFVVESLRALAAGDPGVPESLRAGVLSRVARAGPPAEDLLRAAAVLGPSFAPATVGAMLGIGVEEAIRRCERLLTTRLTVVAGRAYEFANDLVQEVLYAATPEPTRIAHHLRAADLLAGNPEAVARHAAAGGDDRRAARAWLVAGQRAADRYAMADAEALFRSSIEAAARIDDAELLGRGHLARGRVREAVFRYDEALDDHTIAARLGREIGEQRLEMDALRQLGGPAFTGSGRPVEEGLAYLRSGLRLAVQLGDRGAEAGVLAWMAVVDCNQLRFAEAQVHARRAYGAAVASGDETAMFAALDGRKTAYAYLGEIEPLTAVLNEIEPRVRRAGDLWFLQWAVFESAFPHLGAGRWDRADGLFREAQAINARSGYTGYPAWYVAHRAWLARLAGRTGEALELGGEAVAMDSHAWITAAVMAIHATTLLSTEARAEAVPLLERGLEVCETHRTAAYRLRCLAPLAEATGSATLLAEADAALRAMSLPAGAAWLYGADVYVSIARAWLARGDHARAAEVLEPLLAASQRTGWFAPLASARSVYSSSASMVAARRAPSVSTGR